jgi:hypothetical protein
MRLSNLNITGEVVIICGRYCLTIEEESSERGYFMVTLYKDDNELDSGIGYETVADIVANILQPYVDSETVERIIKEVTS